MLSGICRLKSVLSSDYSILRLKLTFTLADDLIEIRASKIVPLPTRKGVNAILIAAIVIWLSRVKVQERSQIPLLIYPISRTRNRMRPSTPVPQPQISKTLTHTINIQICFSLVYIVVLKFQASVLHSEHI